jgi:ferredoxin-NADP reductase
LLKNHIDVQVSAVRQLTPRVREFVLTAPNGQPLPAFDAGAHIALYFSTPQGPVVRHYSLVRGPDAAHGSRGAYTIAVQREDRPRGSAYIHAHFAVGTRLAISRPKNNFALNRRDTHSLLIAGGIGITPMLGMVRSLVQRHKPFDMVYAGKRAIDMAYLAELEQLTAGRATIHCSTQRNGVRLDIAALLAKQAAGTSVYVCGPQSMVADTQAAAAALGWAPERIHSELFTPAATGTDVGFELVLQQSGRTLTVGPHTSILEAMTAAGLHPLFDCGRGECGLCPLSVVEAQGTLVHRDRFLSTEEKAAGNTLCICVSRVNGPRLVLAA